MDNLIILRQLPIIEQTIEEISQKIDNEIREAKNTIPSDLDKTSSHLKKIRAKIKKEFEAIESQRKKVKSEILKTSMEFEAIYQAQIKEEKEQKLKDYFEDIASYKNIDVIDFEDLNLKINLSESMKSYYSKIDEILNRIDNDLKVIKDNFSDEKVRYEIILNYKKTLNLAESMLAMKEKEREIKNIMDRKGHKEILEAPNLDNEEKFEMSFTVTGTKKQLKALKEYLTVNNLINQN